MSVCTLSSVNSSRVRWNNGEDDDGREISREDPFKVSVDCFIKEKFETVRWRGSGKMLWMMNESVLMVTMCSGSLVNCCR